MPKPLRRVTESDQVRIEAAYNHLGIAMSLLRDAGATKAADFVGRCRKSTWGALTHCKRALWKHLDREGQ